MSALDDIELQKQNDLRVKMQVYPQQPLPLADTQKTQNPTQQTYPQRQQQQVPQQQYNIMNSEQKKRASLEEIYKSKQLVYPKDGIIKTDKLYKVEDLPLEPNNKQSQVLFCHYCRSVVHSEVQYKSGCGTHWLALFLFIFTAILFFWVPYVFNRCKNAEHYCSQCHGYIGVLKFGQDAKVLQIKDKKNQK